MKCLVVIAHPVTDSLCHALAQSAIQALGVNIKQGTDHGFSAAKPYIPVISKPLKK